MKAAVDARVNAIARADQDKIFGRVIDINVHKIFNDGERKGFGRIREADAGTGPTSVEAISIFTIERLSGVGLSQNSVDRLRLTVQRAVGYSRRFAQFGDLRSRFLLGIHKRAAENDPDPGWRPEAGPSKYVRWLVSA